MRIMISHFPWCCIVIHKLPNVLKLVNNHYRCAMKWIKTKMNSPEPKQINPVQVWWCPYKFIWISFHQQIEKCNKTRVYFICSFKNKCRKLCRTQIQESLFKLQKRVTFPWWGHVWAPGIIFLMCSALGSLESCSQAEGTMSCKLTAKMWIKQSWTSASDYELVPEKVTEKMVHAKMKKHSHSK